MCACCEVLWHCWCVEDGRVMVKDLPKLGLRMRFCHDCKLWMPMRSKHCRDCGACVRRFDHHCGVLSTCVGEHNHFRFVMFLCVEAVVCAIGLASVGESLLAHIAAVLLPASSSEAAHARYALVGVVDVANLAGTTAVRIYT